MPSVGELEAAFRVYFDEIGRCINADCYWALPHVVVSLPDICGALESENGRATGMKYVDWCRRYLPAGMVTAGMLTPEDYWDIRNLVLHQGRTRARDGRYYKFTKPTQRGGRVHRFVVGSDVVVLDVGELATEMVGSIRAWFEDLQGPGAKMRRENVGRNLPSVVTVKEQELPGIGGVTFNVHHTSTE